MLTSEHIRSLQQDCQREEALPRVFSVLGDASRWRLFRLLIQYEQEDLCVSELAQVLGVSVPAVSQQLKLMEMAGIVKKERTGQKMCYRVDKSTTINKWMVRLAKTFGRENKR